jgi:cytochrome bd-type quinol oxidase subunit 2
MDSSSLNSFMSLFMVFIGVLSLYAAFTGKGPVFNNDYPKSMKEDANKLLRKFCWYIGPVTLITGGMDYFWVRIVGEEVVNNSPFIIAQLPFLLSMVLTVPAIVIYVVIFRKRFKEQLKKKA